jgi:hypothetical protein
MQVENPKLYTDRGRFLWITTIWTIFAQEEEIIRASAAHVEEFLDGMALPKVTRPTLFTSWAGAIKRAIEEETGSALTSQTELAIKRWAAGAAKAWTKDKLYEPRQAKGISRNEVDQLLAFLWFRRWPNLSFKATALVTFLAARTGARVKEITALYIEDLEETMHEGISFLRMPLRSSKSNTFKDRREALILPFSGPDEANIRHWLRVIKGGRSEGLLFQNTSTAKVRDHFRIATKHYGWKRAPTAHSLRIFFVISALESGASETDIQNLCRWRSAEMICIYKNRLTEVRTTGAAYKVYHANKENDATIGIPSTPTPEPQQHKNHEFFRHQFRNANNGQGTSRKKQGTIQIRRRMAEASTQTDPVNIVDAEKPKQNSYEALRNYIFGQN